MTTLARVGTALKLGFAATLAAVVVSLALAAARAGVEPRETLLGSLFLVIDDGAGAAFRIGIGVQDVLPLALVFVTGTVIAFAALVAIQTRRAGLSG